MLQIELVSFYTNVSDIIQEREGGADYVYLNKLGKKRKLNNIRGLEEALVKLIKKNS